MLITYQMILADRQESDVCECMVSKHEDPTKNVIILCHHMIIVNVLLYMSSTYNNKNKNINTAASFHMLILSDERILTLMLMRNFSQHGWHKMSRASKRYNRIAQLRPVLEATPFAYSRSMATQIDRGILDPTIFTRLRMTHHPGQDNDQRHTIQLPSLLSYVTWSWMSVNIFTTGGTSTPSYTWNVL